MRGNKLSVKPIAGLKKAFLPIETLFAFAFFNGSNFKESKFLIYIKL
jgi:hypothetical protein